jgi:hypothetical protein
VTRPWLAFGLGLLLLATPLREVWLLPALGLWGPLLACGALLALARWAARP